MNKAAKLYQDKINLRTNMEVLQRALPYLSDPTQVYNALSLAEPAQTNHLLLESAEIESKQDVKSLLLIDAAVRIECIGSDVILQAKTINGQHLLASVLANANPKHIQSSQTEKLHLRFAPLNDDNQLDEDSRLQAPSVFDALRLIQHSFQVPDNNPYTIFIGGLFAYDLVANFEPLGTELTATSCPDYLFYVAETMMIFDHQAQTCQLQANVFDPAKQQQPQLQQRLIDLATICSSTPSLPVAAPASDLDVTANISDADFSKIVQDLKQFVIKGDVFQVVPSRRFSLACPSPLAAYRTLKNTNPSPYMFYMQDEKFTLFGASPESALKYDSHTEQVEIYPIAGTRRRGKNVDGSINFDLDSRIELELRGDSKENAEHMMLVDLARNDVARIASAGSRYVADLLKVDRYSHVMHLVSRVVGTLRDDLDALHAYQACMNMGTLTGAPKVRAMQLIHQVEQQRRGSYGGAVGYLTGDGSLDTCIVIRSAYVENGIAHIQAGAGVVFDSDPQAETDETRSKAQAVISAIQIAHHTGN